MEYIKLSNKNFELINDNNIYNLKQIKFKKSKIEIKSCIKGYLSFNLKTNDKIKIKCGKINIQVTKKDHLNILLDDVLIIYCLNTSVLYNILLFNVVFKECFDWHTYINNYKDLQNAGINNEKKAYQHWINYGKHENRIFNKNIMNSKISNNNNISDNIIINLNNIDQNIKMINDNIIKKINDNYIIIDTINNLNKQITNNETINDKFIIETLNNKITIETIENKIDSEIINDKIMTEQNNDKINTQLINKITNEDFIVKEIINEEIIVKEIINEEIMIKEIINEEIFNWNIYLNNYKDLEDAGIDNEEKALNHWNLYGRSEGRHYYQYDELNKKINEEKNEEIFNWNIYLNNYKDLQDAGIDTEEKALNHWNLYGKAEGRHSYQYDENYFNLFYKYNNFKVITFTNIQYKDDNINDNFSMEHNIMYTKSYNCAKFNPQLINYENIHNLYNLILIIDFPNYGGGTTVFINDIISHYKKNTTFLIARNYDDKITFTINDEYELSHKFSDSEAILFLEKEKNKISKIFINHSKGHSILFLNKLFELSKNITTITHDYYNICEEPNPLIHSIKNNYNNKNKININKYNTIITQNKNNLFILNNFIADKNKQIIVTNLPDFRHTNQLINTNNDNLVIGLMGAIGIIKGQNIIKNIIKYYKNTDVKIILFGLTNIDDFSEQYTYNNIDELNQLLINHKPNVLIETSIWPETYSYTLSLKMITDLPILYIKKPDIFVVENRLSKYNKAYPFETIDELNTLATKYRQDYFYTILPSIYYNSYWDDYFIKKNKKNIVFITSKIYVSNEKFNYVDVRSIYTKTQRFEQTLETINSIKSQINNYYIILFDNSIFNNNELNIIKASVDLFINITDDKLLNYYTNNCKFKAYGEIAQTYYILKYFPNIEFENIFKISGRYLINKTFNNDVYNNNDNIFKLNENVKDRIYIYTSFYKINYSSFIEYNKLICKIFDEIQNSTKYDNIDLEVFLPAQINKKKFVNNLGITQNIAVWKDSTCI